MLLTAAACPSLVSSERRDALSYLLTAHGTVVCRNRITGTLVQRALLAPPDDAELLSIGNAADRLQAGFEGFLANDLEALNLTFSGGSLANWRAFRAADKRALHLGFASKVLTAHANDDQFDLTDDQQEGQSFLAVSAADLEALRTILRSSWMIGSTGACVAPAQVAMTSQFTLRLGSVDIDLRWNLPLRLAEFPCRLGLLRDGWRIERICLYRPLIYYGAFGSDTILDQLALSLHSLCTVGGYQGDVAVLTDRPADEIERLRPAGMAASLAVVPCDARDRTAYMSARYSIGAWPNAWNFQPLLYVDTDILFDRDVSPMLRSIAQSDRIAAPIEPTEPLGTSPAVGATLLQRDGCSPRFAMGFNSGTLGIPNLGRHEGTLQTIARIIANHCAMHGREAFPYVDQEIANYVSYRIGHFDTALITPYVRLAHALVEPSGKRGLVHYCWVPGADYRVEVMRNYLQRMGVAGVPQSRPAYRPSATTSVGELFTGRLAAGGLSVPETLDGGPLAEACATDSQQVTEALVQDALEFAAPARGGAPTIDLSLIGRLTHHP